MLWVVNFPSVDQLMAESLGTTVSCGVGYLIVTALGRKKRWKCKTESGVFLVSSFPIKFKLCMIVKKHGQAHVPTAFSDFDKFFKRYN